MTIVANKIDLAGVAPQARSEQGAAIVYVSALTGAGIDLLVAHLKEAAGIAGETAGTFSARRRHLDALDAHARGAARCASRISTARSSSRRSTCATRRASLSELTGELTSDDLLGEIFATFCIGK